MSRVSQLFAQRLRWSFFVLGSVFVCVSCGAQAAQDDCNNIVHSTVPYQASITAGEVELKYLVERSATGMTTVLVQNLDGKITKLMNRGTFPMTMTLPTGDTASFEYSVPTDKPLYDQKVDKIHMKLKHGEDVLVDSDAHVEYMPDEKMKIGDCVYDTKHYVQTITHNGRESRSEIWFAPGLELSLKTVTTIKAGDKQQSQTTEATNLTTSFTPFKEP